ncbi:DUF4432 family protein [Deinococcus sp.]|uniref:DUF4432 family protein n=1 Tax=Deinococcus sp. TaxID=47478 RepID=UPI003C7D75A5
MPTLWGEQLSKREFLARVGHHQQVGGLRRVRRVEGVEDGLDVIELRTGAGLELDILASRGLDLGAAWYQGRPLSWLSASGFAHPALRESTPGGFERAFGGGLLTTCGLSNVGNANTDQGTEYVQHGRAATTPAFDVGLQHEWAGEELLMTVSGKTREAVLYGDQLEKTRTLRAQLGVAGLELEDRIENIGARPAEVHLLYHLNLGWPLIGPGTALHLPTTGQRGVVGDASDWATLAAPNAAWTVGVTEHQLRADADGWVRAQLEAPGMRFRLAYSANLSRFTQWRQFGRGDYVLGLEPGTVGVLGRAAERAAGTLNTLLEPGERLIYRLRLAVEPVFPP